MNSLPKLIYQQNNEQIVPDTQKEKNDLIIPSPQKEKDDRIVPDISQRGLLSSTIPIILIGDRTITPKNFLTTYITSDIYLNDQFKSRCLDLMTMLITTHPHLLKP